jgi:hypothetical protein
MQARLSENTAALLVRRQRVKQAMGGHTKNNMHDEAVPPGTNAQQQQ